MEGCGFVNNSLILEILLYLHHSVISSKIIAAGVNTDCAKCARNASGLPIIITMGAIICIQIILCLMTPFITIFIYKKCKFILTYKLNIKFLYDMPLLVFINSFKQKENR